MSDLDQDFLHIKFHTENQSLILKVLVGTRAVSTKITMYVWQKLALVYHSPTVPTEITMMASTRSVNWSIEVAERSYWVYVGNCLPSEPMKFSSCMDYDFLLGKFGFRRWDMTIGLNTKTMVIREPGREKITNTFKKMVMASFPLASRQLLKSNLGSVKPNI